MKANVLWIISVVVLAVVLSVVAFLLWQKWNDLDTAKAQLADSQQRIVALEGQTAALEQTVSTLKGQLADAKQKLQVAQDQLAQAAKNASTLQGQLNDATKQVDALNKEITALKNPPLTAGQPVISKGTLAPFSLVSIPIELQPYEQVQGEFIADVWDMTYYILDPTGKIVQDFGKVLQTNFRFTTETNGRFTLVIRNHYSNATITYTVRYTIYHK